MRDELDTRFLDEWLHATDVAPPDPQVAARRVASRLGQTRQVGRRWWLPALHANATAPTAIDATAYQPRPIGATNGHTPTVIGRTQTMFSPVKAFTAAAVIVGIGSAFLVAQPLGQQGSVPGAATDTAPVAPVWVTGTESMGPACADPSSSTDDGVVARTRGWQCHPTWETSDPRLTGDVTAKWNADVYRRDDGEYTTLAAGTYDLRNDGGGWHCEYADALKRGPDGETDGLNDKTATCIGGDGYEGLTAVLFFRWAGDSASIEGLLFGGDVPPLPEAEVE
jgi:hypothetical protein